MVMRAIEAKTFSGYSGLRQTELPKPQPGKDRVLVRVTAAGVTDLIWKRARMAGFSLFAQSPTAIATAWRDVIPLMVS
jgi:D-arabinose 1-dehydrogenase-like Zn-dependent alcohol dehydrogenase